MAISDSSFLAMIFVQSVNAEAIKYLPGSAMISTLELGGKYVFNLSFITQTISVKMGMLFLIQENLLLYLKE